MIEQERFRTSATVLGFILALITLAAPLAAQTTRTGLPVLPTIARLQYDGGGDWYANPVFRICSARSVTVPVSALRSVLAR